MPAGDYANQRYSKTQSDHRSQCRQVAGGLDVLDRGAARHEGGPLIVGNTMYVPHAVSQQGLCPRSCQRKQDHLEV